MNHRVPWPRTLFLRADTAGFEIPPNPAEKGTYGPFRGIFDPRGSGEFYSHRPLLSIRDKPEVTTMMRMGPEALSVKFKTDPRADLALFAQLELARRDLHEGEAALRMEQEYLPVTYSAARRLVRWGRQWLRSD